MTNVPLWLYFQIEVLDNMGVGASFSAVSIAEDYSVDTTDASEWIQKYLDAQRGRRSQTKYVLHRQGRTSNAVWTIGKRTQDARTRLGQFGDDIHATVRRAVRPDIHRLAEINPRAARAVDNVMDPLLEGLGQTVTAMLNALGMDDEEQ